MLYLIYLIFKKDKEYKMEQDMGKNGKNVRIVFVSFVGLDDVFDSMWEIVFEEKVYDFNMIYFCFIVINLLLRLKYLCECVK